MNEYKLAFTILIDKEETLEEQLNHLAKNLLIMHSHIRNKRGMLYDSTKKMLDEVNKL